MIVWKLQTGIDYTNFYFPLEEEKVFFTEFVENYFDESKSAQDFWKPLILLKGEPKKATHFFEVNGSGVIAMGPYGNLLFEDGLGENVEFLPLETDAGPHNVLNVIGYLDCLDKEKSKITLEANGLISDYSYLRFKKELLAGIYLFKIPELPYTTFVTRTFEKIYTNHVGKGLDFRPEDCSGEDYRPFQKQADAAIKRRNDNKKAKDGDENFKACIRTKRHVKGLKDREQEDIQYFLERK